MTVRILAGDCREVLRSLPADSVHCCVTSPPYFGLRDYGVSGQIGLEQTPDAFVAELVAVFAEVRRVLRDDGTLWLNMGDSYCGRRQETGVKGKDLIGIPWRTAFALRADGWYLRQRMPWVKRNPMPESTRDRPTSAIEEVFLLSKSSTYYYDYDAVKKPMAPSSVARLSQAVDKQAGSTRANGGAKTNGPMKAVGGDKQSGHGRRHAGFNARWDETERTEQRQTRAFRNTDLFYTSLSAPHGAIANDCEILALDVATRPFKEAHFATFPPALVEPCILAGCPADGTVLDPFGGAGTTGLVANRLGRNAVMVELNPEYAALAEKRIADDNATLGARRAAEHDQHWRLS